MSEIKTFLQSLFADKPDGAFILIWRYPEKTSHWFSVLDEAEAFAAKHAASDLYVGVGLSPKANGLHKRCEADEICAFPALWIDIDVSGLGEAHQKKNLPPSVHEALAILPPDFPPSMVVHSGHGLHAWWLFKEMEVLEDGEDRDRAKAVIKHWERYIRLRAQSKGWTIDATHDLARILRIPGTTNNKIPEHPVTCRLFSQNEQRYNLSDFEEFLEGIPLLALNPGVEGRRIAAPALNMEGLLIDTGRSLDHAKLAGLVQADLIFADTWHHRRREFIDQSQSSYDLAIGNALYEAGLTDQEIIDALIQNRREHGAKFKLRLDYFKRTLTKIRTKIRIDSAARLEAMPMPTPVAVDDTSTTPTQPGAPPEAGSEPKPQAKYDTPHPISPEMESLSKPSLCESLSHTLGLIDKHERPMILRIMKLLGTKPSWRIDLHDGRMIHLVSATQFLEWGRFRTLLASSINRGLKKFKPAQWDAVTQVFMSALVEQASDALNNDISLCHQLVDGYLLTYGVCASATEALAETKKNFRAFEIEGGRIAIYGMDLRDWAARTWNVKKEPEAMAAMLAAIGAESAEYSMGEGRAMQSRLILPATYNATAYRKPEAGGDAL